MLPTFSGKAFYIRTLVTRTVKENEKQFELEGNMSHQVNFREILIKGSKEIYFDLAENSSYPSSNYRGSTVKD